VVNDGRNAQSEKAVPLAQIAPGLRRILTVRGDPSPVFDRSAIRRQTIMMPMRDGIRLATDLYRPPSLPAPVIVMRTPYERAHSARADALMAFARAGYVVVSQDCRGTGDSEPDHWDWRIYEPEDSFDCVEWVQGQEWCNGFIASCGGSYVGSTQWEMAHHPRMSAIAPEVSGFINAISPTARRHLVMDAYSRSVGKGPGKSPVPYLEMERLLHEETLAGGYYNEPLERSLPESLLSRFPVLKPLSPSARQQWLWAQFNALPPDERAGLIKLAYSTPIVTFGDYESLATIFGPQAPRGRPSLLDPRAPGLARALRAPALMITAWYDWGTQNTLDTWHLVTRHADPEVASRCRLLIAPDAHNVTGYHEGQEGHPELERGFRTQNIPELLLHWYETVRDDEVGSWPTVIYYLMGANEWHAASAWPPANAKLQSFYPGAGGKLTAEPESSSRPDIYVYNPADPTPTLGGSIVSSMYRPGSVDVSAIQKRPDVLTYTTPPLVQDLDVVGSLSMILYASSSAVDTDFHVRLTDVFPDGRAIQLQSGVLRTRFRTKGGEPELMEPGRIYRLEIDMWATANRFKAGHRLRVDIASADFPRFDRNTNRGGTPGDPIPATQTIYHDAKYPSELILSVVP
jgi:hypothetical protein